MGTDCAEDGAAAADIDAAISNANAVRMPIVSCSVIRCLGFLFNASSCLAFSHFMVV
jgi:hypothetical protein